MPVVSQSQRRFMYAAEEGKVPGVKPSVGKDFIDASHGITDLPEKKAKGPKKGVFNAMKRKK